MTPDAWGLIVLAVVYAFGAGYAWGSTRVRDHWHPTATGPSGPAIYGSLSASTEHVHFTTVPSGTNVPGDPPRG